jgi:hypothetical protein
VAGASDGRTCVIMAGICWSCAGFSAGAGGATLGRGAGAGGGGAGGRAGVGAGARTAVRAIVTGGRATGGEGAAGGFCGLGAKRLAEPSRPTLGTAPTASAKRSS